MCVFLNDVKTCPSRCRQQRLCGRKTQADLVRRSCLLRDEVCIHESKQIRRMRIVKRVENKMAHHVLQCARFCTVKPCSKSSLVFTVILNTLLLVIMRRKQAIDHLRIYRIITGQKLEQTNLCQALEPPSLLSV